MTSIPLWLVLLTDVVILGVGYYLGKKGSLDSWVK